jgi:hypothetical protein
MIKKYVVASIVAIGGATLMLAPTQTRAWVGDTIDDDGAAVPAIVHSRADLNRLLNASGATVQWIGWDRRGRVAVYRNPAGVVWLRGSQSQGDASLVIDGYVSEIGVNYFNFVGKIDLENTPDPGRMCHREGPMTFRVTQNRRYWRLQNMEACDGLTDYVDIYF